VLPLKMRWPHLFDGTALVVGSMAPDLLFLTYGTALYVNGHGVVAQFWLCLPLTVVLTIAIKRVVAGPLGPHLPEAGGFHLRSFARLSAWPRPRRARAWLVLVSSALIGSFSHLVLDAFTHSWGYVAEQVDALQGVAFRLSPTLPGPLRGRTVFTYDLLQVGLTLVGSAVTIWLLHRMGRQRRLREWYPDAEVLRPTPTSRRRLAIGMAGGAIVGATISVLGWAAGTSHGLLFLVVDGTGVGLVLAGRWARQAMAAPRAAPADPVAPPVGVVSGED
jgi:hypothetical protein